MCYHKQTERNPSSASASTPSKMVVPRRKQAWGRSDRVYETLDVIFERTFYEPAETRRTSELTCRFRDVGQETTPILKAHTVSGKSDWDALTRERSKAGLSRWQKLSPRAPSSKLAHVKDGLGPSHHVCGVPAVPSSRLEPLYDPLLPFSFRQIRTHSTRPASRPFPITDRV